MTEQEYAFAVVDGIAAERKRIRARIQDRINDLRICHKNDECKMLADHIEGYLPEWVWE